MMEAFFDWIREMRCWILLHARDVKQRKELLALAVLSPWPRGHCTLIS